MATVFPFLYTEGQKDVRKGRNSLEYNYGWFYIHFLVSVQNCEAQRVLNKFKEQFDPLNSIEQNWYCSHFNSEEFSLISEEKIIEIFEHRKPILKETLETPEKFLVKAYKGWKPKETNAESLHIGFGNFVVKGITSSSLHNDKDVLLYETYKGTSVQNRFSAGFLQNGKGKLENENHHYRLPRTLSRRGIDGRGQIVACGDTGVDVNHNFFYDKDHQIPYDKTDFNHRKVVHYETIVDRSDPASGHGTHVAGTILGKSWDNMSIASLYDGVASEAKLWFIDLCAEGVSIADFDLEKNMTAALNDGAHIYSASYVSSVHQPLFTYNFDLFSWNHKDFLFIVAAGNDFGISGNRLGSPSDGINVLSVANTLQESSHQIMSVGPNNYTLTSTEDESKTIQMEPQVNNIFDLVDESGHLIDVEHLQISTEVESGKICLIGEGENLTMKANKAIEGGAAFILYDEVLPKDKNLRNSPINVFSCKHDDFLIAKTMKEVSYTRTPKSESELKVADSSTRGPSILGVLKPDISAPGTEIYSANSKGKDSVPTNDTSLATIISMTGTSMATPAISGCAALFRQYFTEGWYPSLKPTKEDEIKPSASLLRAAIENSAGMDRSDFLGYGIPNLELGMGFQGHGVMFVNDEKIAPKEEHAYEIQVEEDGILSIALSYVSPPCNPESFIPITNLIQMRLESSTGEVFSPKERDSSRTTNTKFSINAKNGTYHLFVTSNDYDPRQQMQYSLAIRGKFPTQKIEKSEGIVAKNCGNGKYANGRCVCPTIFTGTYCQKMIFTDELNFVHSEGFPMWYKAKVKQNADNILTVNTQNIDSNIRICLSTERDIDINYKMSCYKFTYEKRNQRFHAGNGSVYLVVYPDSTNAYYSVTEAGSDDQEQEEGDELLPYTLVFSLMIAFFVILVIVIIAFIIYCTKHKKNYAASSTIETPLVL